MTTTEKTLKKHIIYEGKILTLRRDEALLPNGQTCFREMVEHPGGVAVCLELDGKIAFVRQFRYPYGTEVLELPAGKLDKGAESPAHCGSRELLEETGWYCPPEQLRALGEIYPSPGYTAEKIHLFYADRAEKREARLDEDEFLNVEWLARAEAERLIAENVIKDAKTVIAVLRTSRK